MLSLTVPASAHAGTTPPFLVTPAQPPSSQVSALVRGLTYPSLRDGPGTAGRPPILGVRDRVCFVAHNHQEDTASSMRQRQDDGVSASKVNGYEVRMVAKTVKHLLLQGYEPDQVRGCGAHKRRGSGCDAVVICSFPAFYFCLCCGGLPRLGSSHW